MSFLLKLKRWQFFILLVGFPLVIQMALIFAPVLVNRISSEMTHNLITIKELFFGILYLGWLYTLGTKLHAKLPNQVKMNLQIFLLFLTIPCVYMLSILIYISASGGMINNTMQVTPIILPIYLISIFCALYNMYFIARALRTVELHRPVTFGEWASDFFLICFFPIGIWMLQPRINRIFG